MFSNELSILGWSIVLGLVHVFFAAFLSTRERGLAWNAGNRDGAPTPLSPLASRADRARLNFLETFPFFAAALLGTLISNAHNAHTLLGAQIYLAARAVYLPVYVIGVPYVRTLVWAVALWGLLQLLYGLF